MKQLILIIILSIAFTTLKAQANQPQKPERTFAVPFTVSQLDYLNLQGNKADSAMINGHNLVPTVNLLRLFLQTFNQAYQQQSQQAQPADTTKRGKKGGKQ